MKWLKKIPPWQFALLLVLAVGAVFLIIGYDAGLPLYESVDERHHMDEVYILRGLKDDPLWIPGYPPGILYVNYGAQLLVELQTGDSAYNQPCLIIHDIHVIDIFVNLLTALLIAMVARKLGGDWAGVLAALAWLVAPRVLQQNQFGFPQVYEGPFYLLSLYTTILAVEKRQPRYALLSVAAGLATVVFKYATFPVLGLGVGAALWNLKVDGRHWLRILIIQIAAIIVSAVALVILGGVGSLAASGHDETTFFLADGIAQLINPERLKYFVTEATQQVGIWPLLFIAVVLVGSVMIWLSRETWRRLGWLGLVGLGLSHVIFMVTYMDKPDLDRNMLSSSGLLIIMVTVSVVVMARWLSAHIGFPIIMKITVAMFMIGWLWPQVAASWKWVQYRDLPVTYSAMVEWVIQNLPEEKLVVSDRRPFTRSWSCFTDVRRPDEGNVMTRTIEEWLARDVYYAQLTQVQVEAMRSTPEGRAYLDQMTLLQQFPPPGEGDRWRTWRRGHEAEIAVYQLWPVDPDFATEVTFGDQIRLVGYDLDAAELVPGATLNLRFYWQPVQQPTADYNVFVHLVSADDPDTILAQHDGVPSRSDLNPTSTWHNLNQFFTSRDFPLVIPDNLEPGAYILSIGLYNWRSGERLLTDEGHDTIEIPITFAQDAR